MHPMREMQALVNRLMDLKPVIVACSGGVDSALLADVAHEAVEAKIVTAVSESLAPRELGLVRDLAAKRGWDHSEVTTSEINRPEYQRNDPDRCFWCKDTLFDVLDVMAVAKGATVCVGTNLDDLSDHRPGLVAAKNHQVAQPLVDAGFTKTLIRQAAADRGLPVADKPASPCLASRVAYGVQVTKERLSRIANAETRLWERGVSDVRVRDLGEDASIELTHSDLERLEPEFASIEHELRELGFAKVVFDPRGLRSGSMNELIGIQTKKTRNSSVMEG
jgi:pyridinium-3,5-biscarboxylic acid mononucleotide sulfurtransferase